MRAVRKIFIGVASSICFFTVRRRSQEGPFPENVYLAKRRYSSHLDRTRNSAQLYCTFERRARIHPEAGLKHG
jgi:hypothetical protein